MAKLLTLDDRLKIENLLTAGLSMYRISQEIDFADSTIRDEVKHNSEDGRYVAEVAHRKSIERRKMPKKSWRKARLQNGVSIKSLKNNMTKKKAVACRYCHGVGTKSIQTDINPTVPVYVKCIVCKGEGNIETH